MEHALQMLAEIGDTDDARAIEPLTQFPMHAVRWSAIGTAFRLGHPERRELVERATGDPHPHVRHAARKTLETLGESSQDRDAHLTAKTD